MTPPARARARETEPEPAVEQSAEITKVVHHFVKLRRALWSVNHDPDLGLLSSQARNLLAQGRKAEAVTAAVETVMRQEAAARRKPPRSFSDYEHLLPEAIGVTATGRGKP